jgi:hypothetical protein
MKKRTWRHYATSFDIVSFSDRSLNIFPLKATSMLKRSEENVSETLGTSPTKVSQKKLFGGLYFGASKFEVPSMVLAIEGIDSRLYLLKCKQKLLKSLQAWDEFAIYIV